MKKVPTLKLILIYKCTVKAFPTKLLFIILITSSTISDAFFYKNIITFIDRYLSILLTILTCHKIYMTPRKIKMKYYIRVLIALCFLYMARSTVEYNNWHNFHYMWHILIFSTIRYLINESLYLV